MNNPISEAPRRVVIQRDAMAPLYALKCAEPCSPDGWCMAMGDGPDGGMGCYLGGAKCETGARIIAERAGYEVVGNE